MDLKGLEKIIQKKISPSFEFSDYRGQEVPFARLARSMSAAKIAVISSGGFHLKEDVAFDTEDIMGDASFRRIPKGAQLVDLGIAHTHYDHKYVEEDLNCALPLEIMEQLAAEGAIGALAETNYSFMGYCLKVDELMENAQKVGTLLLDEHVEAAILAPT